MTLINWFICRNDTLAPRDYTTNDPNNNNAKPVHIMDYFSLRHRQQIDVLMLDLSKKIDKLSHHILFMKLEAYGISGSMLICFGSYLANRHTQGVFNKSKSERYLPQSGLPQGSILGPLLFVIYIDELADILKTVLKSRRLCFADDSKIPITISSLDN